MGIVVLLMVWLVATALLAPRFGVDTRDGFDRSTCCR
jgi:hypothetical protein